MSERKIPDLIGAIVLMALGTVFTVGAVDYDLFVEGGRIGPGFMPAVAGVLMIVFGVLIGVEALLQTRPDGEEGQRPEDDDRGITDEQSDRPDTEATDNRERAAVDGEGEIPSRSVFLLFGLTLVALLLTPILGFFVSFGLLILSLVTFVEQAKLVSGIILSVSATAGAWLVFEWFLQIPLPTGILGLTSGG